MGRWILPVEASTAATVCVQILQRQQISLPEIELPLLLQRLTQNQEGKDLIHHTILQKSDSDGKVTQDNKIKKNPGTAYFPRGVPVTSE